MGVDERGKKINCCCRGRCSPFLILLVVVALAVIAVAVDFTVVVVVVVQRRG